LTHAFFSNTSVAFPGCCSSRFAVYPMRWRAVSSRDGVAHLAQGTWAVTILPVHGARRESPAAKRWGSAGKHLVAGMGCWTGTERRAVRLRCAAARGGRPGVSAVSSGFCCLRSGIPSTCLCIKHPFRCTRKGACAKGWAALRGCCFIWAAPGRSKGGGRRALQGVLPAATTRSFNARAARRRGMDAVRAFATRWARTSTVRRRAWLTPPP